MDVRPGYKQTDVGVIPEDWDTKALGDIGESLIGLTYKPTDVRPDGILVLRSSNIQDSSLRFDDNVFVDTEVPRKIMVRAGDVLICVRNGSRELIGKSAILDERTRGMTFGAFMAVFRTPISQFVYQQFQSRVIKRQIREHLGATINQITNKSLNSFCIPLPRRAEEQTAIAEALSDADALIESLEQLLTKKRQVKQGAMHELLAGKRRLPGFSGEWETKRLGEIGTFSKGKGIQKDQVTIDGIPCIRYGEIYTYHNEYIREFRSFISPAVARESQPMKHGDILFAGSGETAEEIGKCVAFLGVMAAYAGGDIIILSPTDQDSKYLGYLLNHPTVTVQKARMGQGDAVVHISARNLALLTLCLPRRDEQEAIATVLSDMDAEIDELEQKVAKARQIKQGMMQELLTGRIRLPLDGGEHDHIELVQST